MLIDDGRAFAVEVIGQLLYFLIAPDVYFLIFQDCLVQDALEAGFEIAVEVSGGKNAERVRAGNIDMLDDRNVVFSQGAGLIRAEDVHGAESRNGIEALDQNAVLGHLGRALSHINRHDHGQEFRSHADGDGEREQERIQNAFMHHGVNQEDNGDDDGDDPDNQEAETLDAFFKSVLGGGLDDFLGDLAEFRMQADAGHQEFPETGNDVGAGEDRAVAAGRLFRGQAFAGQAGFVQEEIGGADNLAVRRHDVAGGEGNDIAGHEVFGFEVLLLAVAEHASANSQAAGDLLGGLAGLMLLIEVEDDAQEDHGQDDGHAPQFAGEPRNEGGDNQDDDERILEIAEKQEDRLPALGSRDLVIAEGLGAADRFLGRHPFRGGADQGVELLQAERFQVRSGNQFVGHILGYNSLGKYRGIIAFFGDFSLFYKFQSYYLR